MYHRTAQTAFIHTSVLPYIQLATGSPLSCRGTEMHQPMFCCSFKNMRAKGMVVYLNTHTGELQPSVQKICFNSTHNFLHLSPRHLNMTKVNFVSIFYTFFNSFHTFTHLSLTTSVRAATERKLKKRFNIWCD